MNKFDDLNWEDHVRRAEAHYRADLPINNITQRTFTKAEIIRVTPTEGFFVSKEFIENVQRGLCDWNGDERSYEEL